MADNLRYIDLHCDTVTMLHYPKENLAVNKRMVTIDALQKGGALVQCVSAFVPTGFFPKPVRNSLAWKRFERIAYKKDSLLQLHQDKLMPIENCEDIEACNENGKTGILFTIEDAGLIGNDLKKIEIAYNRGVRIVGLIWNHENTLAFPNSLKSTVMQKGLKPLGIEAIQELNRLGMIIDVSHLSDGGFWDAVKYSKKPIIATHSNSREITSHPRNMTDEMIKALAQNGGIMGLNFAPDFLMQNNKHKNSRIEDMVRHIKHIKNIGSSSVLAIGTDFDGIHGNLEIGTPADMFKLSDALLKAGLTYDEIEDMWYKNALRVFKEVWN